MQALDFNPPLLKPRLNDSHKGSFGHVLALGGDHGFGGAIIMAAEAALISGAGMVSLGTRSQHTTAALTRCPEVMAIGLESGEQFDTIFRNPNALILGPGLGQSEWSHGVFERSLMATKAMVIDADALNLLAQSEISLARENWVLTPHPAEAGRLLGVATLEVQADRLAAAQKLQNKFGGVVVLKGSRTLVVDSDNAFCCELGNPAMSTAGMGDVLSGIIGGLLAQDLSSMQAAKLAVWAHAKAGDLAARALGRHLRATEIFPFSRHLW